MKPHTVPEHSQTSLNTSLEAFDDHGSRYSERAFKLLQTFIMLTQQLFNSTCYQA